jgi:hypothetical protein
MLTRERLLHPATMIATMALLVALSGAGFAAAKIGTGQLRNGAVTTAKLKNNAVTAAKLRAGAVGAADLAGGAVTASALAGASVTSPKIAPGAVGGANLANGAVTEAKLGPNAVTGPKIAGGTITAANIAPGQVVTGAGQLVSGRLALAPGTAITPLLTMTAIARLDVDCSPGSVPTIQTTNLSGTTQTLAASGVNGPSTAFASGIALPASTAVGQGNPGSGGVQRTTLQLSYTGSDGAAHVATATVSLSEAEAPATGCVASGQALTTG